MDIILSIVTGDTVAAAIIAGVALGGIFLPTFGRAIGAQDSRGTWGAFVGVEVIGLIFLLAAMTGRALDGSDLYLAWVGAILLWTIMAVVAALTRRLIP
jgi:hypothetical protein